MKIFRKTMVGFVFFIFGLLLCFNVYQLICTQVLKESLATINGYGVLEVVSGSMEPTIHVGDLIIINTKYSEISENDIVTFLDEEGSFVTHRVISIMDGQMVTRGDNNNSNDPLSSIDTVVGKYVFKLSGLGILLSSLKNPFVMFMIFVVGILICYYLSLDHEGKLIVSEEEKDYQEFLEYQKEQQRKKEEIVQEKIEVKSEKVPLKHIQKTSKKKTTNNEKSIPSKKGVTSKKSESKEKDGAKVLDKKSVKKPTRTVSKSSKTTKVTTQPKIEKKSSTKKTTSKNVETSKPINKKEVKTKTSKTGNSNTARKSSKSTSTKTTSSKFEKTKNVK